MPAAAPANDAGFPYRGPDDLRDPIASALRRVVDPEVAMSIVDLGLVYGVSVDASGVHVLMTMTSAACPVIDVILDDVEAELDRVVPAGCPVRLELVWQPAWGPERMSARGKAFMGW